MQKCEKCRKFGDKLNIKGDRCASPKCALTRRAYAPGAHGPNARRSKKSEYGLQLHEKQKAKAEYGLRERQFRNTFQKAAKAKEATGEALLQRLELRLDNVIYRLGWAVSRPQARLLVNHGHIKVNGAVVDIPSYEVKVKDVIEPRNNELIKQTKVEKPILPDWLTSKGFKGEIAAVPSREQIDTPVDEQLIVEFYSR